MNAINADHFKLDPIEIDPGECVCGHGIEAHIGVNYLCPPADPEAVTAEIVELERLAELRKQQQLAEILERISAPIGSDDPPRNNVPPPYRTAASTISAFKYVVSLNDADYLARWLANHPADAPELFKIWKGKRC
jgi:hypothetical protein